MKGRKINNQPIQVFANGYLKPGYLNHDNYTTLTGFVIEVLDTETEMILEKKLKSICAGVCFFSDGTTADYKNIRIPAFKLSEIPGGEFVWLRGKKGHWTLRRASATAANNKNYTETFVVPHLIAETARHAEYVKRWAIDGK